MRLFASLREKLPDAIRGRALLDVDEGSSLGALIADLDIPPVQAQMVLVNGQQSPRGEEARGKVVLREGDSICIFPPIAGG